jgi:hypothetical protein
MKARLTLAFAIGCLVAFAAPPRSLAQQGEPLPCAFILLSSPDQHDGAFAKTFSALTIADLKFSVLFSRPTSARLGGDHTVELRVFGPGGHLYQSLMVPFSSDSARAGQQRVLEDYPRPVTVELVGKTSYKGVEYSRIDLMMPVGGTSIVTSSLYGQWRVEAFVDGNAVACGRATTFTITQ